MNVAEQLLDGFRREFKMAGFGAFSDAEHVFAELLNHFVKVKVIKPDTFGNVVALQGSQFAEVDGAVSQQGERKNPGAGFRAVRGVVTHDAAPSRYSD